jgi:hypothetical protein
MLRRIFGLKKDEVTGDCRKLNNEELGDLYSSSNIIRVIKSRRMKWAGHVACMEERRGTNGVFVGIPEGTRLMEDEGVERRIILRWVFRKWDVGAWSGSSWLRTGTGGRHLRKRL